MFNKYDDLISYHFGTLDSIDYDVTVTDASISYIDGKNISIEVEDFEICPTYGNIEDYLVIDRNDLAGFCEELVKQEIAESDELNKFKMELNSFKAMIEYTLTGLKELIEEVEEKQNEI